ncbi:MAG: isopeptide-forming domain-containing fimbrial protein [Saccharofermentanales bacterium]|jgi:fimbrial isopeptide formation D2 family protein/LPXTG-motif cell wall-anchored protein|nr:isopeptide-forming domain-containing fimbrial protein [Bacillota bacterium]
MLAMVMILATTAFAATVTVPTDGILKDHTFTAYQVFTGREEDGVLSDIQWGNGIDSSTFLAALKADTDYGNLFTACTTAADVANVLSENKTNTSFANRVAKLAEKNRITSPIDMGSTLSPGPSTLHDGYYLIVDTTDDVGEGGAYNAALLEVVGNIDITVKTDAPSVEKKVFENVKFTRDDGYGAGYNDVADYNMGDAVPFHLIGRVPDMSRYDTYKYIFHDTLSNGLTPPSVGDIAVYLSSDKIVDVNDSVIHPIVPSPHFEVSIEGQNITVSSNNIKGINGIAEGMYIIVEFSAVLNQGAVVGLNGNPNEVYLEYSNKPDQSGSGDTNNTGQTPIDEVVVFTYELDVTKVDGKNTNTKLANAQFVLLDGADEPSKVAKITDGKFDGWLNIPAADQNGIITWPATSKLTSDAGGLFSVSGLDDGTYKLREIAAPAGYNMLTDDIKVVITATTTNVQNWEPGNYAAALTALAVTADDVAGTGAVDTGIAAITIANNAGSTLPETGGIGTTIFYIIGSVLVVAAVVFLVTRKRMGSVEK